MKIINFRASGFFLGVLSKAFLASVLLSVWAIQAASLGKLTVNSYLGQPLNAEIVLESVTNEEIDSLSARLASSKVFQKVGVNLAPYHATLSVSVKRRNNGHPYIHLSSSRALNEPVLNLLIELSSSSGLLLREYNVLLDPVETQKPASADPIAVESTEKSEKSLAESAKEARPVEQAVSPVQSGNTYGPVVRGDNLSNIARQVAPGSVNLNQMLVALYRANRDAFLEGNMNLLKTGVVLHIPAEDEVLAITTREASREVAIQRESWDDYRQKVAASVVNSSENSKLEQAQSGKIKTVSEESLAVEANKPEEVLILSKGEMLNDSASVEKTTDRTAQDYLRMMEEDAIAKEHALQEASERVTMLEQNVMKLQRLLDLKESVVAEGVDTDSERTQLELDLQEILAESKPVDEAVIEEETGNARMPTTNVDEGNTASPFTIPAQPVKPAVSPDSPQSANVAEDEPDFVETLVRYTTENSQWVAAGLGALLMSALGVAAIRRRRRSSDEMDDDFSTLYDDAENEDALPTELASSDGKEMHELSEKPFDQQAVGVSETDNLDTSVDNHTDVDPGVFFGGKQDSEKAATSSFFVADVSNQMEPVSDSEEKEADTTDSYQFEHQEGTLGGTEEKPIFQEDNESEQWVFTSDDDQLEKQPDTSHMLNDHEEDVLSHDTEHQLDFDIQLPEENELEEQVARTVDKIPELDADFANIDLDLGEAPQIKDESFTGDAGARQQEIATKLDLAKAYLEMDDSEGARDILEEVLREGDQEQQSSARSLLDKLG